MLNDLLDSSFAISRYLRHQSVSIVFFAPRLIYKSLQVLSLACVLLGLNEQFEQVVFVRLLLQLLLLPSFGLFETELGKLVHVGELLVFLDLIKCADYLLLHLLE